MQKRRRITFFILVILIGITSGLIYGWLLSPSRIVQVKIDDLRMDYKTDYVLMAAERFHASQDLSFAKTRLLELGTPWHETIDDALEYASGVGYSESDLTLLTSLSDAMISNKKK